ncbi:hypothetical protein ACFL6N_00475 [Thermodesulfobacteriota bacterium]
MTNNAGGIKRVLIFQTEYEHEKLLIEDVLVSNDIPFTVEFKKSIQYPLNPILGPWSFYIQPTDKENAAHVLKTLPITATETADYPTRESNTKWLVFSILLAALIIFIIIFFQ